jgi:hypothetical protein
MALDWNSSLSANAGAQDILPVGEYPFYVANIEKTYTGANSKIPGTPMAKVTLAVQTSNGTASVIDNLVLSETMEWKLASFFECIGLKKKGQELGNIGAAFDKAKGCEGHLKIKHEDFNGQMTAKVGSYVKGYGKVSQGASAPTAPAIDEDSMPFEIE